MPAGAKQTNTVSILKTTPEMITLTAKLATMNINMGIIRDKSSSEIYKFESVYIGLEPYLAPPENMYRLWTTETHPIVLSQAQKILVLMKNQKDGSDEERKIEPEFCMAGYTCSKKEAAEFLAADTVCPPNPVLLRPTVWIRCGGKTCKKRVGKGILLSEPPLRDLQNAMSPVPLSLIITLGASRGFAATFPESSEKSSTERLPASLKFHTYTDIFYQYTLARFTAQNKQIYSTIGGSVVIEGERIGITSAHGIVDHLTTNDSHEQESNSDSAVSSHQSASKNGLSQTGSSYSAFENSLRSILEWKWSTSTPPRTVAYLGRGTSSGNYSFPEVAPSMSDFALVQLEPLEHGHSLVNYLDPISNDELCSGNVDIRCPFRKEALSGLLMAGDSFLVMDTEIVKTRRILVHDRDLDTTAISGSGVFQDNRLCGIIYAGHKQSPYMHMLCAEDLLLSLFKFRCPQRALQAAAESGQTAVVERLIRDNSSSEHSSPHQGSGNSTSPMSYINSKDKNGHTALMCAVKSRCSRMVELLLQKEVDVNLQDAEGQTALMWAVKSKDQGMCKRLLNVPMLKINVQDSHGHTALFWAVKEDGHEIVKLLLARKDVDACLEDKQGLTPLQWAVEKGFLRIADLLLNEASINTLLQKEDRHALLIWAVKGENRDIARRLLEDPRVDVNAQDKDGFTPLIWAIRRHSKSMVELLLHSNAWFGTRNLDITLKDKDGRTPLLWAVQGGDEEIVQLLIRDRRMKRKQQEPITGPSMLISSVLLQGIAALLGIGRNGTKQEPMNPDEIRYDPLWVAIDAGRWYIARMLVSDGNFKVAEQHSYGILHPRNIAEGGDASHAWLLKKVLGLAGINLNQHDDFGLTPLSRAILRNDRDVVRSLMTAQRGHKAAQKLPIPMDDAEIKWSTDGVLTLSSRNPLNPLRNASVNLDQIIKNDKGTLTWGHGGFIKNARKIEIRAEGPHLWLRAELRQTKGRTIQVGSRSIQLETGPSHSSLGESSRTQSGPSNEDDIVWDFSELELSSRLVEIDGSIQVDTPEGLLSERKW